jgi:hypothetical protein
LYYSECTSGDRGGKSACEDSRGAYTHLWSRSSAHTCKDDTSDPRHVRRSCCTVSELSRYSRVRAHGRGEHRSAGHGSMWHALLFDVLPRAGQSEQVPRREWKGTNNITRLTGAVIGLEAQARSHEKGGVSRALTGDKKAEVHGPRML